MNPEIMNRLEGWQTICVPDEWYERAYSMRTRRDERFNLDYFKGSFDKRAAGDLGEIAVHHWFIQDAREHHEWLIKRPKGKPDFILYDHRVEVKTQNGNVPWLSYFHNHVYHRQINPPAESFFFCYHEVPARRIWLLGGISCELFRRESVLCKEGEPAEDDGWVPSQTCYRVPHNLLTEPLRWLQLVREL